MDEKSLGKRLQEARRSAGLTQQELCHKAGLSYSTLAKIERGAIKSPSIFTIVQIAAAVGTTLDELMGQPTSTKQTKLSKSGISFVFFDVNGCLLRFFHSAFTRLAEKSGAPADLIETTFWHYNDAVCSGKMPLADFNKILGKQLDIPGLDWKDYYLSAVDPIKEMHDLVTWASKHYHVGLLTNIMPGFVTTLKKQGLIPNIHYDAIIDSSEVGYIKPDREIYEAAQAKAGVSASEILLIDDSRTNIMAAERLGWHVLWFDDFRPKDSVTRVKAALELAE
ncbi:MAG: HAD-IA family hydrolase [Candidatus Saccharibacteria bacterium]|nr:HAD-IA family hydrolase [Candidatus Saccharibacteria bacterium]